MVSRSEVISAYRHILRREPESEAVIAHHTEAATTDQLYAALLGSDEFRSFYLQTGDVHSPNLVEMTGLPIEVEVGASADKLAKLSKIVEKTWTGLGRSEPYWSVLTNDSYRKQAFDGNSEEFLASGKHDLERLSVFARRGGVELSPTATCFELGCGVGRITRWLAGYFSKVIAADISQPHIDLARQNLASHGTSNVSWVKLDRLDDLTKITGFDVFFSVLVLQHNPPPVIAHILETILGNLNPGGLGYFQVPTYHRRYTFNMRSYLSRSMNHRQMEMHVLPQKEVFRTIHAANCIPLEVREDGAAGEGWLSNTFLVRKLG
ncbi:MAG TPA: class I SAM-dependent methyltransferase [Alphaproteobacteria bacterium]|nr:class I SAM-dependent methyltransferase [Alphaproteobacteria bacterium]